MEMELRMTISRRLLFKHYPLCTANSPSIAIENNPLVHSFSHNIVGIGSCFAGHISRMMEAHGISSYFDVHQSQHFSTKGIREKLESVFSEGQEFSKYDFHEHSEKELRISLRHAALFTAIEEPESVLFDTVEALDDEFRQKVLQANTFIITLGSPTYLVDNAVGKTICAANGLPREKYNVVRAKVSEIVDDLRRISELLEENCLQPCDVIITLSPQRYAWYPVYDRLSSTLKEVAPEYGVQKTAIDMGEDGIVYSNGDKAILRTAIDEFLSQENTINAFYFPSYDIVMDELRGVETFSHDLNDILHVGKNTASYVCNRFLEAYCSNKMKDFLEFNSTINFGLGRKTILGPASKALSNARTIFSKLDSFDEILSASKNTDQIRKQIINHARAHYCGDSNVGLHELVNEHERAIMAGEEIPIPLFCSEDSAWISFLRNIDTQVSRGKRICLYGTGSFSDRILKYSQLNKSKALLCVDKNHAELSLFFGYPVFPPQKTLSQDIDCVIIASYNYKDEIKEELDQMLSSNIDLIMYGNE